MEGPITAKAIIGPFIQHVSMIFRKEILGADKQDEEQEKVQLNLSTDLPTKTTSGTIWDMYL